eukprot:m.179257 g.179257  ORF g.179257 m.179257 type:complete len:985 (-) comp17405_c2_seq2:11-2965(-)
MPVTRTHMHTESRVEWTAFSHLISFLSSFPFLLFPSFLCGQLAKVLGDHVAGDLGDHVVGGAEGEAEHLCVHVWLDAEEDADLAAGGVEDGGADAVVRLGVDVLEAGQAKLLELLGDLGHVNVAGSLDDVADLAGRAAELLPLGEEVVCGHDKGQRLEELVEEDGQLEGEEDGAALVGDVDVEERHGDKGGHALKLDCLLDLHLRRDGRLDRLGGDLQALRRVRHVGARGDVGHRRGAAVAKEDGHAADALVEVALYANLQDRVLVQDALVGQEELVKGGLVGDDGQLGGGSGGSGSGGLRLLLGSDLLELLGDALLGQDGGAGGLGDGAAALELGQDARVLLDKGRHLLQDLGEDLGRGGDELQVLAGARLDLGVGVALHVGVLQHVLDLRLHLREEVGKLDVGGEQEGAARRRHERVVALQHVELLLRRRVRVVGNEVAKLAQNVRADRDHGLVAHRVQQRLVAGLGRIILHVGPVDDNLDDAVPHLLGEVVAGQADEAEDDVDVPLVVGDVLLGEDGDLEDELLADGVVGRLEELDQLLDDGGDAALVADGVEDVGGAQLDGGLLVLLQRLEHGGLVLLDGVARELGLGNRVEALQRHVAHVDLLVHEEAAQLHGGLDLQVLVVVVVDQQVDRLHEAGIDRVVVLLLRPGPAHLAHAAGARVRGARHKARQRLVQAADHHVVGWEREDLEEAEELDGEPGGRHVVVHVVAVVRGEEQAVQAVDGNGDGALVLLGVGRGQRRHQTGRGGGHAQVRAAEDLDDARRVLAGRELLGRGAVELEQGQGSLLAHKVGRLGGQEEADDLGVAAAGQLLAANVGDAVQGQADAELALAEQVRLDAGHDHAHQVAVLRHEHRDKEVAHLLLAVLERGHEVDGLEVAKLDLMAQQKDEEQLADVLLLLVAVERLLVAELGADVGQLLVDALVLGLARLAFADVGDEEVEAAHLLLLAGVRAGSLLHLLLRPRRRGALLRLFGEHGSRASG